MKIPAGLYGITCSDFGLSHIATAKILLENGVKTIQYREKKADFEAKKKEAFAIKEMCREFNSLFIINDDLDLAVAVDADGVHLGQKDLKLTPIGEAKRHFGNKIIGISAAEVDQAVQAETDGAAYIGAGAVFSTTTQSDSELMKETGELARIVRSVNIPVIAIGGIKQENVEWLKKQGVHGIAVISGIFGSGDAAKSAANVMAFRRLWQGGT